MFTISSLKLLEVDLVVSGQSSISETTSCIQGRGGLAIVFGNFPAKPVALKKIRPGWGRALSLSLDPLSVITVKCPSFLATGARTPGNFVPAN